MDINSKRVTHLRPPQLHKHCQWGHSVGHAALHVHHVMCCTRHCTCVMCMYRGGINSLTMDPHLQQIWSDTVCMVSEAILRTSECPLTWYNPDLVNEHYSSVIVTSPAHKGQTTSNNFRRDADSSPTHPDVCHKLAQSIQRDMCISTKHMQIPLYKLPFTVPFIVKLWAQQISTNMHCGS